MLAFIGWPTGAIDKNKMTRLFRLRKLALLVVLTGLLLACSSGPPVQEMSDARQAIAAVHDTQGSARAADLVIQARQLLQSAEFKLRRRAYNGAKVDAVEARRKALEALEELEGSREQR